MPACAGLLEPRESRLELLNLRLMPKNSYACCTQQLGLLSPAISSQFTLKLCAAAKNCEKFIINLFWRFKVAQGHRC